MRAAIDDFLATHGGAAARAELRTVVSRNQLDDEVARGHLAVPFPRAYCRPWDADHVPVLERAAVASVGGSVALSHVSALRRLGLSVPADDRVHVTVGVDRHPIGRRPGLYVHRTRVPIRVRDVDGVPTVVPAAAIVRSWPMLAGPDQRAPAIAAVRRRLVTVPGLRHGVRQKVVQVRGEYYRIDIGFEAERVAVELDGYRYHSGRRQRERDRQRDAALASIDWLSLRFSHERLHGDVPGCRRATLATLAARRAWRRCG